MPLLLGHSQETKIADESQTFIDGIFREEIEYMKVVYETKYPKPEDGVCEEGGENFVEILIYPETKVNETLLDLSV